MTKQNLCTDNVFKIHSVYVWKSCFFVGEYKYLRSWHKCLGNGYPYEINWGILFNLTQLQIFSPSCIILSDVIPYLHSEGLWYLCNEVTLVIRSRKITRLEEVCSYISFSHSLSSGKRKQDSLFWWFDPMSSFYEGEKKYIHTYSESWEDSLK